MKSERIKLLKEILVTQMNHWAFLPVYVMVVTLGYHVIMQDNAIWGREAQLPGQASVFLWAVFGVIPFVLFLTRYYVHKAFLFFAIHFAMVGMMFLLPAEYTFLRIVYVGMAVIYTIYSLILWTKTDDREDKKLMPAFAGGLTFAMLYVLHRLGYDDWSTRFGFVLICVIAVYFVVYYIEQYQRFLVVNSSSASHIPAEEMFRSGLGLVSVFSLLGLLMLLLTSHLTWMKGIVDIIKNALLAILRFFLQFLPQGGGEEMSFSQNADLEMAQQMAGDVDLTGETFWVWKVLENIISIAMSIALAVLLVAGIVKLIKFIRGRLKRHPLTEQKSLEEVVDVHEKIELPKEHKPLFTNPFERLEPAARIRQLYRKKLLASKAMLIKENNVSALGLFTARESARKLESIQLAAIYEKARYSNEESTAEDVKRMREACK
ncbi:MAG: DUF4129 domain-containing protein [Lachnospiraceae bacterium]|nr:DUF4129 domain-containing protein [Lachnospiraceae bacterium]